METTKHDLCKICKHNHDIIRNGKPLGHCDLENAEQFAKCIENNFCLYEPQEQPKHAGGRPPKFKTPEDLEAKAEEYFKWCDANPVEKGSRKLVGAKQNSKGSEAKSDEVKFTAKRPYTLDGLAIFIGISRWRDMRDKECYQTPEFVAVINAIDG